MGRIEAEVVSSFDELDCMDGLCFFCFDKFLMLLPPWYLKNSIMDGLLRLVTFATFPEQPKQGAEVSRGRDW